MSSTLSSALTFFQEVSFQMTNRTFNLESMRRSIYQKSMQAKNQEDLRRKRYDGLKCYLDWV